MSAQINIKPLIPSLLPLVVIVSGTILAVYFGLQSTPLPLPPPFTLHPALETLPEKNTQQLQPPAGYVSQELFYRSAPPEPAKIPAVQEEPAEFSDVRLSTIVTGKNGSYCIINNTFLHTGESNELFTVEHISYDKVRIRTSATTFSLLPGQTVVLRDGLPVADETKKRTDK